MTPEEVLQEAIDQLEVAELGLTLMGKSQAMLSTDLPMVWLRTIPAQMGVLEDALSSYERIEAECATLNAPIEWKEKTRLQYRRSAAVTYAPAMNLARSIIHDPESGQELAITT